VTLPSRSFLNTHGGNIYACLTVLLDGIVVVTAIGVGYAINFPPFSAAPFFLHQWKLVLYSATVLLGLSAVIGVYRRAYSCPLRLQCAAAVRAYAIGTPLIFATLFLFQNTYYSRGALLTYIVTLPALYLLSRVLLNPIRMSLHHHHWGMKRAILVHLDHGSLSPLRGPGSITMAGFDVRAVLDMSHADDAGMGPQIMSRTSSEGATTIIIDCGSLLHPRLALLVKALVGQPVDLRLLTPEVHDALSFMRLYDYGGIALSASVRKESRSVYLLSKRLLDLIVSAILIVLSAPIVFVVGMAIRWESSGGVFFRQMRFLSQRSRPVRIVKFRSMDRNAGGIQPQRYGTDDHDDASVKSRTDPRVTRVGRVIRKYSLDEIPQLYNVVTGEISLVGPRPLPLVDFGKLPPHGLLDFLLDGRTRVQPGLTGLWQISGRSRLSLLQMVILDLYYAENRSFLFDLEILFETIPAVLTGEGAY